MWSVCGHSSDCLVIWQLWVSIIKLVPASLGSVSLLVGSRQFTSPTWGSFSICQTSGGDRKTLQKGYRPSTVEPSCDMVTWDFRNCPSGRSKVCAGSQGQVSDLKKKKRREGKRFLIVFNSHFGWLRKPVCIYMFGFQVIAQLPLKQFPPLPPTEVMLSAFLLPAIIDSWVIQSTDYEFKDKALALDFFVDSALTPVSK